MLALQNRRSFHPAFGAVHALSWRKCCTAARRAACTATRGGSRPRTTTTLTRSTRNSRHSACDTQNTKLSDPNDTFWQRFVWTCAVPCLCAPGPAFAAGGVSYDPSSGENLVKNISGAFYIALVIYFAYKVLTKRAKRAREERLAGNPTSQPTSFLPGQIIPKDSIPRQKATPLAVFLGAAQAGLMSLGLYILSERAATFFEAQPLPEQYTAHNISMTVRTVIIGCGYLATFIFAANSIGLTGLMVQMVLFPDSIKDDYDDDETSAASTVAALPKVGINSNRGEIKRAFDQVQQVQQTADKS